MLWSWLTELDITNLIEICVRLALPVQKTAHVI